MRFRLGEAVLALNARGGIPGDSGSFWWVWAPERGGAQWTAGRGSVQAAKLRWEMLRTPNGREQPDLDEFDELKARRARRVAAEAKTGPRQDRSTEATGSWTGWCCRLRPVPVSCCNSPDRVARQRPRGCREWRRSIRARTKPEAEPDPAPESMIDLPPLPGFRALAIRLSIATRSSSEAWSHQTGLGTTPVAGSVPPHRPCWPTLSRGALRA
jgi:hypothetical protein